MALSQVVEIGLPPCVARAQRFVRSAHLPFVIGAAQVGWLRRDDVRHLSRWPQLFEHRGDAVRLSDRLDSVAARSAALAEVAQGLLDSGRLRGWRNEIYAIRNGFAAPPLALIERAAARFFGIATYAVHANGLVHRADAGDAPALWIARRSLDKSTDPGMLDNLVGGGIAWGFSAEAALVKESWEESGVPESVARHAVRGRVAHVLTEVEQGTQAEQLFIFDLLLPPGFRPEPQDGEVAEHRCLGLDALVSVIADGAMTVDASIATLDCCLRQGWLRGPHLDALNALFVPSEAAGGLPFFRQESIGS